MNATTLSKWVLVAMIGAGLSYLILGSHVRGVAAQIRDSPAATVNVEASVEMARAPTGGAGTKFRFGFLEFEDGPDASTE